MAGFVRFVVHDLHPESGRRQGVFAALGDLDDAGALDRAEIDVYRRASKWFDENLLIPARLSRANRAGAGRAALSWFKDSAIEHVRQMRCLVEILDAHGVRVEMLRTRRPGFVVYEDRYQVAAEPFSDTDV